ncbi:MAG: DUF2560 family protein [Peptostreptococcaceae bacterium]
MTVVQMTDAHAIRLNILQTVNNDAAAFTEAHKFVGDEVLKLELFKACYAQSHENTPLAKAMAAATEAKQRYDLITAQ